MPTLEESLRAEVELASARLRECEALPPAERGSDEDCRRLKRELFAAESALRQARNRRTAGPPIS